MKECVVLLLLDNHVPLLLFKLLLQEVDQVITALRHIVVTSEVRHHTTGLAHAVVVTRSKVSGILATLGTLHVLGSSFLQLLFQSLDNFLAEVGAFSKLLLDLFMDFDLALISLNLLLHLVVLEDQDLSLLRLMLKLGCELVVLENGQVSSCLQLLVVHGEKISLSLLDIEEHFFAQLLSFLDTIKLLLIDLLKSGSLLDFKGFLQISD